MFSKIHPDYITFHVEAGTGDGEWTIKGTYEGLEDTVTVKRTGRVAKSYYYKNLSCTVDYPLVSGKTYHVPANGATINSNNCTGSFSYTYVTVYDDNSESEEPNTVNISTLSAGWKSFVITGENPVISRGTEPADEGTCGTSIKLTITPTGWKNKTGAQVSCENTVNLITHHYKSQEILNQEVLIRFGFNSEQTSKAAALFSNQTEE